VNGTQDGVPAMLLAVNAGSSSLKLALFRDDATGAVSEILRINRDHHAGNAVRCTGGAFEKIALPPASASDGEFLAALCATLKPHRVVHRVVHGGDEARFCVAIDAAERARLHALSALAPLHQPPALRLIDTLANAQPALPQYACFDTAFHAGMPAVARDYALPAALRARHPNLHAFGFHGISCQSAVENLRAGGELPARLVIAHLGSGASVTAVLNGRSVATSMGFSALEGLVMATRPGRLDAGVLLYLLRHETADAGALEELLYRQSGLLGYSALSADMRVLLASDEAAAQAAVDLFVYRAAQEIAALCVALDGIDTLLFTGGIGENQAVIRERITDRLRFLGEFNVRVLACDEERSMAQAVRVAVQPATTGPATARR
jgi:acetate kinase